MSTTQNTTESVKGQATRPFKICVYCQAYYKTKIDVPANLTKEEAFTYAKEHLQDIPITELKYIPDSDELDDEDLENGESDFAD